MLLRT
jgi:hypothetical protein